MALVDYTSSDEEQNKDANSSLSTCDAEIIAIPRKQHGIAPVLPPLPSKFHDLYASTIRMSTKDDPSLHGGRVRGSPHIVGNWPTHIYLEWYPSMIERNFLDQLIMVIRSKDDSFSIISFLTSELKVQLPLHVSLSRSIQIITKQKDSFITSFRQSIETSGIRPFQISFTKLAWVSNFEGSRWFLILRTLSRHGDELQKLLQISNTIVKRHGLPALYEDPKSSMDVISDVEKPSLVQGSQMYRDEHQNTLDTFHVSIAWSLTPPGQALMECMESITDENMEDITKLCMEVEYVKMKIGNDVLSVPLLKCGIENGLLTGI